MNKKLLYESIMMSVAKEVKRTILNFVNEAELYEKTTLTKRTDRLTYKIVNVIQNNRNENIADIKDIDSSLLGKYSKAKIYKIPVKYKDKQSILYVIVNENSNEGSNTYANDLSFKDNRNIGYLIINVPTGKTIDDNIDSLAHELRHYYDLLTGQDTGNINNTYDPGKDEGLWDGFLYRISPTELNAFYTGFKKWIEKDTNKEKLKNWYKQTNAKNVDEFIERLSKYMTLTRHNLLKANNKKNEKELSNEDQGKVENPLRVLEYNYYILNTPELFMKFINFDPVTGEKREDDKNYIILHLAVYNNGDTSDLNKIYNKINSKYKQVFNSYKTILQLMLNK